jgi:hypothetical protein
MRLKLVITALALVTTSLAIADDSSPLLKSMAGTWDVHQRMWSGPDTPATDLPPAIARRTVVDGKYLEEVMEPAGKSPAPSESFRRHALMNYNSVAKQYEYTSLDTRAPQLMTEISARVESPQLTRELQLQGGRFVAAEWGTSKNVPFTYRLTVGPVIERKQTVQLYLTPEGVLPKKEFLAFEYVYSKQ